MAVNRFTASVPIDEARAGLDRVRADHEVDPGFPDDVLTEADAAIAAYVLPERDMTEAFRGVVIEQRRDDGIVQLSDPAIRARCRGKDLPVGEWVDAWLSVADPRARKVVFDVTPRSGRP